MYDSVKTTETRETFSTGAKKHDATGKGRYDLLPAYAIHRLAVHFENGSKSHGDENWRKGIPLRRTLQSLIRHAFQYLEGHRDEDHMAAVMWNAAAIIETEKMIERGILPLSLNDLPNWLASPESIADGVTLPPSPPGLDQVDYAYDAYQKGDEYEYRSPAGTTKYDAPPGYFVESAYTDLVTLEKVVRFAPIPSDIYTRTLQL